MTQVQRTFRSIAPCALVLCLAANAAAQQRGYVGALTDGTRLSGKELSGPPESPAEAKLDDVSLFKPDNPVGWLRNRSLPLKTAPQTFLELTNGDILTGEVSHYVAADAVEGGMGLAHLVVSSLTNVDFPGKPRALGFAPVRGRKLAATRGVVRVDLGHVRRIVWSRRASENSTPNTVYCRDGRILTYQSLRWEPASIKILREEGPLEIGLDDIAELHLDAPDAWSAYLRQLAVLIPDLRGRLVQYEMEEGLRVTSAANWNQLPVLTKGQLTERYLRVVQPVWSLDVLWLDPARARMFRYFNPTDFPLTALAPAKVQQSTGLASSWRWQSDRNVQGGALLSGGQEFGWGFGVHAFNRLEFSLPTLAKAFRTRIGLDQATGSGGCAKGIISMGIESVQQLHASPLLVGSSQPVDSGRLDLPGVGKANRRLILTADPVLKDTPAGVDPFEIGDVFDWLEPLLELDSQSLFSAVKQASAVRTPAADSQAQALLAKYAPGFSLASVPGVAVEETSQADRKVIKVMPASETIPCILRRILTVPQGQLTKLHVEGTRHGSSEWLMVVMVDGQKVAEKPFVNKEWNAFDIDLTPCAGRTVSLEINDVRPHPTLGAAYLGKVEIVNMELPKPEEKPSEKPK